MNPDGEHTLTLQDIAGLAHVRRPVVSTWRRRERINGETIPFPAAVDIRAGVEHFARDEVVAWFASTGRGNNPELGSDALAVALPIDADLHTLECLLTLGAVSSRPLVALTAADLVDLADEVDPDDEFLLAEVEKLTDGARFTAFIDGLRSVSFSSGDALARLEGTRLGRRQRMASDLSEPAMDVFAQMAAALVTHLGSDQTYLVDGSAGADQFVIEIAKRLPEEMCRGIVVVGDTTAARRQRRLAKLHGWVVATAAFGPGVVVLSVSGESTRGDVSAIDELQLELPINQVALVVGPAQVLCDRATGELDLARAQVLRTGRLRFAARLGAGSWPAAPRRATGVWCFGDVSATAIEDRALAVADVSQIELTTPIREQLLNDMVASLGNLRGRAFTQSRVLRTSRVISAGEVVPRNVGAGSSRPVEPAAATIHLEQELARAQSGLEPGRVADLVPGNGVPVRTSSVLQLIEADVLRCIPGVRLDPTLLEPGGTVRVFDPRSGLQDVGVDPLALELRHPRARRTEPGDVVFTSSPRPNATVDAAGGNLVVSPARVLRIQHAQGVGAHTLGATINRLPDASHDWRRWSVPVLDAALSAQLETVLSDLEVTRAELERRTKLTDQVVGEVIGAVAAGAVRLNARNEQKD